MPDALPVHVIDDDDAVRESLAFLLESNGLTVRQHVSAAAFLRAAASWAARPASSRRRASSSC